jgi:hypothetical protein
MRRVSLVTILLLMLGAFAAPVYGKSSLPKITGGGQATNNNSGAGPLTSQYGFNAQATGAGVVTDHPSFAQDSTVYPASGEFQIRNFDASNTTVSQGHGDVVCVANMGPSSGVDGGGNSTGNVWEIRVAFDSDGTTVYGSFLIQDNGKTDYMDESFAAARLLDPDCGKVTLFELEPVNNGQIKVH